MASNISYSSLTNNPKFNFLTKIAEQNSIDDNEFLFNGSPYDLAEFSCVYMSEPDLCYKYANCRKPSVLSINIQSLPSKFNDLCSFIYSLQANDAAPDVISLQEIWRIQGSDCFNINGYQQLEYKCRYKAQGGGVGIYVKNCLSYTVNNELSVFHDRIFESIFIDVCINSKYFCIGSVYRTATQHPQLSDKDKFALFCELFSSIAESLNSSKRSAFIFGDMNLDCLKYGSCNLVTEFIDLLFSDGMLQLLTKPTRCTANSASY